MTPMPTILMLCFMVLLMQSSLAQQETSPLGSRQYQVPWRAGHAAAFIDHYVIVYSGCNDIAADPNSDTLVGSTDLWVWDSLDGAWYNPAVISSGADVMLPQVFAPATPLPSPGQMLVVVSNTTSGSILQKLDINSWSWSFPTSNAYSQARASGSALTLVNNSAYVYGGMAVDNYGFPIINAVQNSLSILNANAFIWASGSNGVGVTGHAMCYVSACNCIISFGGSNTGSNSQPTQYIYVYDLTAGTWNVQITASSTGNAVPGARRLHTANCLSDRMIVYGGGSTQAFDSDVWILNAANYPNLQWQKATMSNLSEGPGPRMGHTAVLDRKSLKIYIFGGWGVNAVNDSNMYILDTQAWSWTRVSPRGFTTSPTPTQDIPEPTNSVPTDQSHHNTNALIIGTVVGGVAVLLALLAGIFFWTRRRKKETQLDDKDEKNAPLSPSHVSSPHPTPVAPWSFQGQSDTTLFTEHGRMITPPSLSFDDQPMSFDDSSPSTSNAVLLHRDGFHQVPNEITGQKPNEPSLVIRPGKHPILPIHHHINRNPSLADSASAPLSSSLEVLRSIKTYQSGSAMGPSSVAVTHYTPKEDEQDENWTFSGSVSMAKGPIQYIPPTSKQFSVATSTTANSSRRTQPSLPVIHHQYPSSSMSSVPLASPVTADNDKNARGRPDAIGASGIYHIVSPLEMLATLGTMHEEPTAIEEEAERDTPSPPTSEHSHSHPSMSRETEKQNAVAVSLTRILPNRYKIDTTRSAFIGPSNCVVYGTMQGDARGPLPIAIKSFSRREAWERECRMLSKLKSSHVVHLMEILTIQKDQSQLNHVDVAQAEAMDDVDDKRIKYVTVMEQLDETLASFIRQARKLRARGSCRGLVRQITEALIWCHSNGVSLCDLKPSNIMRKINGPWLLIDFEASRTMGQECVGVITPRYCPPEVARATTYGLEGANGVVATAAVDMWALGCIIYELETLRPLFPNTINDETILHFVSHPSPLTPVLNNGLRWNEEKELEIPQFESKVPDPDCRQLISTLLQRDPTKRGSATDVLNSQYMRPRR